MEEKVDILRQRNWRPDRKRKLPKKFRLTGNNHNKKRARTVKRKSRLKKKVSRKKKMPKRKRSSSSAGITRRQVMSMINRALNLRIQRSQAGYQTAQQGKTLRQLKFEAEYGDDPTKKAAIEAIQFRINNKIYGRGDYKTLMSNYGKWALRGIGAAATAAPHVLSGDYSAAGRGLKRGWRKGAKISKIMGLGDYHPVATNQIVDPLGAPLNPHQNIHHVTTADHDLTGDVFYSNTEFVENIYANVASGVSQSPFENRTYALNPGLSTTFPFLAQIAQNFELYEFVGLSFQYKPTSGEFGNSNSNTLGKVVLCTNYDPDAPAFSSSVVMENYDYACSTKPSCGCVHGIECDPSQRAAIQMYTRTGQSSTKDRVYTDLGTFQLATEGIPFASGAAQTGLIGELWVTYTVKLSRSKLNVAIGENILYGVLSGSITATTWSAGTLAAGSTLELSGSTVAAAPYGVIVSLPSNITVGAYLVTLRANYDADSGVDLLIDSPVNCTLPGGGKAPEQFADSMLKERQAECQINVTQQGTPVSFRVRLRSDGPTGTWAVALTKIDPDYISPGGFF